MVYFSVTFSQGYDLVFHRKLFCSKGALLTFSNTLSVCIKYQIFFIGTCNNTFDFTRYWISEKISGITHYYLEAVKMVVSFYQRAS